MKDFTFNLQLFEDIYGTNDNDTVNNNESGIAILTYAGNDEVTNSGNDVTINSGITNSGDSNFEDNDTINNEGENVSIDAGDGNNNIWINSSNVSVKSGSGNDSIQNFHNANIYIDAGEGDNNLIHDGGDNLTIKSGSGNDTVSFWNQGSNISLDAGDGDNEINFEALNSTLKTGSGNDKINNGGNNENVLIIAGEGNNVINNSGNNVTIKSYAGNDFIVNSGTNVTIDAGDGNDEIGSGESNSNVSISAGGGNDSIGYSGKKITIDSGAGDDSVQGAPDEAIVHGGAGKDTMYVWYTGKKVTMDGGADDDYLWNEGNNGSINGGIGNDHISNLANNVTIEGGDGNDSIVSRAGSYYAGENVLINGGTGDDTIRNGGRNTSVNGGEGNDWIENWGFNATVEGGAGDDTIYNQEAGFIYVYRPNSGNDVINGFSILETLVIEGAAFTTMKSGQDVIVTVGENTITLKNASNLTSLNIVSSLDEIKPINVVNNYDENATINGSDGSNWIRNYAEFVTINSGNKVDDIYNGGNNVVILGNDGADKIRSYASSVSVDGGNDADMIVAGNSEDVTLNGGAGDDVIDTWGTNLLVIGGKGNDTVNLNSANGWNGQFIFTYAPGDGDDVISKGAIINLIDGAEINETLTQGNDTILKIGEGSITVKNTAPEEIIVVKDNDYGAYWLKNKIINYDADVSIGNSKISDIQKIRNYGENVTISGGAGDDSVYNEASNASINSGSGDDYLQIGDWNIENVTADGGDGNDTFFNNGKNASINGGAGDDTITSEGSSENVSIYGGEGNDVIEVQGVDYVVRGGKGNDSVNVGANGNNGGNYKNNVEYIFEYAEGDGDDVVSKNAIISLIDGSRVQSTLVSGNDVILKIGSGSITIKDGATKQSILSNPLDRVMTLNIPGIENFAAGFNPLTSEFKTTVDGLDFTVPIKQIQLTGIDLSTLGNSDFASKLGNTIKEIQTTINGINVTLPVNNIVIPGMSTAVPQIDFNIPQLKDFISQIGTTINSIETTINGTKLTLPLSNFQMPVIDVEKMKKLGTGFYPVYDDQLGYEEIYNDQSGGARLITIGNHVKKKSKVTNEADGATINSSSNGNDTINNWGKSVEIDTSGSTGDKHITSDSHDSTIKTGIGDDTVLTTSNNNNRNNISTGSGNDYIFNNGKNTKIDSGDDDDDIYTCPNSENNTVYGGGGKDTIHTEGANAKSNGGVDDDVMANGDINDVGEEVQNQRDKAKEDAEKLAEEIRESLRKQIEEETDPVIKDIMEKGANSEYLQYLPENEKNAIIEIIGTIRNVIGNESTVIGLINDLDEKMYELYGVTRRLLVKDLTEVMDPAYADAIIRKNSPLIAGIQDAEKQAIKKSLKNLDNFNEGFSKLWRDVGKYGKLAKELPVIDQCISALEFGGAIGAGFRDLIDGNANIDSWDRIVLAGIGFGTSLIPTKKLKGLKWIPGADLLAGESLKLAYKTYAKKRDLAQYTKSSSKKSSSRVLELYSNINDDTFVSSSVIEEYSLSTISEEFVSSEMPEEYYMNNPNIGAVIGGEGNDVMQNNKRDNVWMDGGEDNDNIKNYNSSQVTINGGKGRDLITNLNSSSVQIYGGDDADTIINNYSPDVTIDSGKGDDYLSVYDSSNVKILTGEGNDSIENFGKYVSIQTGDDEDYILNIGANVSINSGNDNDQIDSCGDEVTINAGNGDNSIHIEGKNISLKTGDGSNSIDTEEFSYSVIQTGNGDDKILHFGNNNTINASGGNNVISNIGDYNSVSTDYGEDCIENVGSHSKINTGAGDDVILLLESSNNTVLSGEGNDIIYFSESTQNIIRYNSGNDTIYGYDDESNIIEITNGKISNTLVSGEDLIVEIGKDKLTLADVAGKTISFKLANGSTTKINVSAQPLWSVNGTTATYGTAGNVLVTVTGLKNNAPLNGISLNGNVVTLSNSVLNEGTVTVSNGYTLKLADDVTKSSSTEANWSVSGTTATYKANAISAGYSVSNDGKSVTYNNASGGNTLITITGLKNNLSSPNGVIEGISVKNNVVNVSSTIIGDEKVKIEGEGYSLVIIAPDNVTIKNNVLTASNKFKESKLNLKEEWGTGITKVNAAAVSQPLNIVGNDNNNSIKGGKGSDTISSGAGNDTIFGGAGKDVFIYESGNDLISDYKSDEDKIQLKLDEIINSTLKSSDVILTTAKGTLKIKGVKDKPITFIDSEGNTADRIFFGNESYVPLTGGLTYDSKRVVLTASGKFGGEEINLEKHVRTVTKLNAAAVSQPLHIVGNDNNNSIKGGKGADTISGGAGNDTIFGGAGKDVFIYESGNDLISDYKSGEDKIQLNLDEIINSTLKSSDVILTTAKGTLKIKGVKDKPITFIDSEGNTAERIFFGNESYAPLTGGLTYDSKRVVLTASSKFGGEKINLEKYVRTVTKVNAAAISQPLNIVGNENNNSIKGGKGADTISGGAGNDTIFGGAGKDVFIYEGGNDIISDYKSGEDKIQLNPDEIINSTLKSSDVILTTAKGTLKIKGVKDKPITFIDSEGNTADRIFFGNESYAPLTGGLTYDSKRVVLTASGKFGGEEINLEKYVRTVTKVNAAAISQPLHIVGNDNNNSIKGGKGADTISGGAGHDTLIGGAGNDVFIYESGNDVITDYAAGQDSIKVNGTISNVSYSGKNVVFTFENGSLTVNNAKGKDISVIDDNEQVQTYSQTLDLLYDNNFVADESGIDSISEVKETNYSLGKIENLSNSNEFLMDSIVSSTSFDEK